MANEYSINAKITADSSSFQKNIKDASTTLGSFAKEIHSVTELIGSLFVSQKFINFAKTSINAIEEERKETELLGKTLQITGANAWTTQKQLVDMATAFEQQSNFTQEQIERAQTVMLGFKSVTKDVFDSAMQNVLDMSTVMGMDLVSAVQTVGKALDDPIKGLGSLQRQGFAFSESQKAMLADMIATGNQAKAQKIILDELATTYGGAAKAGQNAFQQLDIAIGNLQKSIGSTLTPVVESITKDITALVNQFNTLDKGTQAFILTAGSLLTTLPLIIKGVKALKIALVSLQTSVPILLAISAAVVGISAAVAHVSKENEIDKFSRELSETQKSADNLLNAFAKGNPAKKLDADVTKELIKLYPELSGKIDDYGTSVEEAAKKVKEIATDKMVEKMALPIAKYKDLLSQAKDDLYESRRIVESGGKDSAQMAREYLEYYRANLAKANDEMKKINEQLKSVGKMLSPEGEIINIPVRFTPHADTEELKKSWKDLLREVFVISDDFSTGKQAANIFITKMSDSLKNDRRIAEALGESFDMAKVLEEQKSKILEAIKDILKSKEKIDKPFSIDELAKADTALGTLAKQYKALSEEIKQYTIANTEWTDKLLEQDIKILEKKRDNAVAVAKNEKKTEQEIYEIKVEYTDKINALQVKQLESQRQTEIKKVKISKESLESQKAIIAQINQYYDTQIAAIKETTVVINKSSNAWDNYFANFKKQAEDWNTVTVKMAEVGTQAMGNMFQQLGQDLVDGGISFENYSAVAVKAISQVLVALSAQITAMGVTHALSLDFTGAALAAAGAAAALVAAGTLSAVASNMKKTSDAAKEASSSLEEFKKRLAEIWSGATSTSGFVSSLVQMNKLLVTTKENVEKADKAYKDLYDDADGWEKALMDKYLGGEWIKEGPFIAIRKLRKAYENLYLSVQKYGEALTALAESRKNLIAQQEESIDTTRLEIEVFKDLYTSIFKLKGVSDDYTNVLNANVKIIKNEIFSKLQEEVKSLYSSLINIGSDLGKSITDGIKNGVTKSDFMETVKEYIKNKVIELVVYTDEFNSQLAEIGTKLASAIASGIPNEIAKATKQIEKLYESASTAAKKAADAIESSFSKINSSATSLSERIKNVSSSINQLKEKLQQQIKALQEKLQEKYKELGEGIGSKFIDSLINGTKKEDFSKELGQYFKEQFIRLTVYTEEFQEKLTSYGQRLYSAIMSGSTSSIGTLKSQIDKLYSNANKSIKTMSDYIDTLFGLGETAETTSKLRKVIKDFNDDIKDLGGDVASNLISSLSSGLDVNSALINFKKFLREYIIKSYVYTESMKGEIEKIGEKIASALSGNLTESRLDRISYDVKKTYNKLSESLKTVDKTLDDIFGKETKTTSSANTVTDNVSKIQKAIDNLKDSLADLGGDVASNFISSLNSGLDLDSALISFKKFIRNYVVQTSVYTESLKDEFSKIGDRVWHYVAGSYPKSELNNIKKAVSSIYGNLAESLKGVDEVLDEIFGKDGDTITKELSKIESAIDSFKKTVSDLGGDVASNLIEGLSNGLSQSDFLTNMKNWIKKMLVQSVVYTEQMKSQIEEIGKAISSAISGGFTETSMHEIRRDLSFIFEQATSKISGIDKILGGVFDGYATGTTSALSGLHIVGERGPELVRFNGGERVYNNADTMKMIAGAGKTNNFNVTFNNLQDTSAFAMMNQLKQYNREMAINGVL